MQAFTSRKFPEVWQKLRPYQVGVAAHMIRDKRHLNYADMGMGKSLMTLLAVMELEAFPCIIICTKSAMYVLEQELRNWFGEEATIYVGTPKQRTVLWNEFLEKEHKFIITNYSLSGELGERFGLIPSTKAKGSSMSGTTTPRNTPHPGTFKGTVGGLVADEIQMGGLFNHKTKTYKVFDKLAKAIPVVFLLTGTPYRRGVIDFYGPLSLVAPNRFKSYWQYVGRYCRTIDTGFGKSIERNPKDIPTFRAMLREYASILKKVEHLKDMPAKQRVPVPVVMEPEQARVYKELFTELYSETDGGELIMTPSVLALSVRLRQLLAAPQVLGLKTKGAALEYIMETVEDLVDTKDPFVIFTPFRRAIPFIEQALWEKYPNINIYTVSGGLTPKEFSDQWQGFQNGRGARVLVCVIKSGASFHATCAANAFFLGYEYDFNLNAQSEDRLHRIGQNRPVVCYYPMHKGTIDEDVAQILNEKQYGSDLVLSGDEIFRRMMSKRIAGD